MNAGTLSDTQGRLAAALGNLPPPLLAAYREQWAPAYAALTIWPAAGINVPAGRAGSR